MPDNIGMWFRSHLAMFGPREVLLTSHEPEAREYFNCRRLGPTSMSEQKGESKMAEAQTRVDADQHGGRVEEMKGCVAAEHTHTGIARASGRPAAPRSGARESVRVAT